MDHWRIIAVIECNIKLNNQNNNINGSLINKTVLEGKMFSIKSLKIIIWHFKQNRKNDQDLFLTLFNNIGAGNIKEEDVVKLWELQK